MLYATSVMWKVFLIVEIAEKRKKAIRLKQQAGTKIS
jgi:hypothetical protein